MTPQLSTLDHLVLTVADIPNTLTFYANILGMEPTPFIVADGSTRHALCFGNMKINLHQTGAEFEPKARNVKAGSADLCFMSQTSLTEWLAHLAKQGVEIEIGPVRRTGAAGPIVSIYIRDPDGNLIEISNPS